MEMMKSIKRRTRVLGAASSLARDSAVVGRVSPAAPIRSDGQQQVLLVTMQHEMEKIALVIPRESPQPHTPIL
eukprot:745717-Hanusia_phi.AAC.1